MKADEQNEQSASLAIPEGLYIPNYQVFKQLSPMTKYLLVRALQDGLFERL